MRLALCLLSLCILTCHQAPHVSLEVSSRDVWTIQGSWKRELYKETPQNIKINFYTDDEYQWIKQGLTP